MSHGDFAALYARFKSPIAALNCGHKCAPYNDRGVPFCCDTHHAVPAAYKAECVYLEAHKDLWHQWAGKDSAKTEDLREQFPFCTAIAIYTKSPLRMNVYAKCCQRGCAASGLIKSRKDCRFRMSWVANLGR
jgi:hypothetical protein